MLLGSDRSKRLPGAPSSPDDVEAGARKYAKRQRPGSAANQLRLRVRGGGATAAGALLALLLVAAGHRLYSHFLTPQVRQLAALEQQQDLAEQRRHGGLLRRSNAMSRRGAALADAARSAAQPRLQPSSPGSNCSCASEVRLADADRETLRKDIRSMVQALSDEHPWVAGVADALATEARPDVVSAGQQVSLPGLQPQRVADEAWGPQGATNIPGVEDLHAELRAYNDRLVGALVPDEAAAARRQHLATAADLGLRPLDDLSDPGGLASLPQRIAFLNELHEEVQAGESLRVCIAATTAADVWGVRQELLPWMQYHTELGAAHFYLLYDGHDAEAVRALRALRHVTLLHIHAPYASPADLARFDLYARSAGEVSSRQWAGQPGNFELMVKQGYGEREALRLAALDGMHWLLHLDPDELFHPGGPAPSLTAVLAAQPPHVPAVRFMNFEGQPEAGDLTNRIEQVTLFRVHKHFITPEAHFWRQKYKLGASDAFLLLYANGKSAVRVDAPGVHQLGPHFWSGNPSPRWQTADNPRGEWRDVVSDDSVVLHYAYSYESDVAAKAHRSCPDSYLEAARRGDRAKVKECFVIDFDADAYIAAAQGPAAVKEFFYGRIVLSEGARVRCFDPLNGLQGWCTLTDIERFKFLMQKLGLYRRLHGPQTLLRQHERRIQQRLRGTAGQGPSAR